jgi:hypothetical protein
MQPYQPIGIVYGRLSQQHRIDQTKDRCIGPNANG